MSRQRGSEVPGQELLLAIHWVVRDALEHVTQIELRIEIVELGRASCKWGMATIRYKMGHLLNATDPATGFREEVLREPGHFQSEPPPKLLHSQSHTLRTRCLTVPQLFTDTLQARCSHSNLEKIFPWHAL
jgi:hypothetical protein